MAPHAFTPDLLRVPHALIDQPALPSRTAMDDQKLDELIADMRAHGFTSAMVLARVGERFEVIAGHRRWFAAKAADILEVPALVYPSKHAGIEAIQFSENAKREDLSPADEAIWFQELYEKHKDLGTDGVAARLGVRRDYFEGRIALLSGDPEVFAALKRGAIGVGVAVILNRIPSQAYRRNCLDQAETGGATVAAAAGWERYYKTQLGPATQDGAALEVKPAENLPRAPEFYTCAACGRDADTLNMQQVMVHRYCVQAILAPAVAMFNDRRSYVQYPRTVDQAAALVTQLSDDFPELLSAPSPSA